MNLIYFIMMWLGLTFGGMTNSTFNGANPNTDPAVRPKNEKLNPHRQLYNPRTVTALDDTTFRPA